MVDSRSLNAVTPTNSFNFKSGDISGTAAKMSDEKMGQGGEYFSMRNDGQEAVAQEPMFVDRSYELRATLNSLAAMNVANILANKKKQNIIDETVANDEEIDKEFENIVEENDAQFDEKSFDEDEEQKEQ